MYGVWIITGMIFYGLGCYAWMSEKPVKFWNFGHQIQVSDVKKYNRAVAKLWLISAVVFDVLGLPLLGEQNSAGIAFLIPGTMAWAIVLMAVYVRIEGKYRV